MARPRVPLLSALGWPWRSQQALLRPALAIVGLGGGSLVAALAWSVGTGQASLQAIDGAAPDLGSGDPPPP